MPTTSKNRRPLPPATGTCRWLAGASVPTLRVTAATAGGPVTEDYQVTPTPAGYALCRAEWDADGGLARIVRYDVDTVTEAPAWSCDCPDATHRPERRHACKHVRALRAALPKLGSDPSF